MRPKNQAPILIRKSDRNYTPSKVDVEQMEKRRKILKHQEDRALRDEIKEVWE